jgi:UDP-3-O-[3-hydroxymyristoyl] glucosamine N-acyltransferase
MTRTLREIAALTGGELVGDGDVVLTGLARIEQAGPGQLSFIANPKYARHAAETGASALLVPWDMPLPPGRNAIRSRNPYFAFRQALCAFHPEKPPLPEGVHPTAVIGRDAQLGEGVRIGPRVVVGARARIGAGTALLPGVVVGDDVTLGEACVVHANASLREGVTIGNRVVIHDGTVIGSDGFGFAFEGGRYHKIPQVGTVVVEDDVEIGANVTVDRATLGETRIRRGAKLDNLIQVAHNCEIGEHTAIAAQAGLSGSTVIGRGVRVGGQAGFGGHLSVGDFAVVGGQSGVVKSVPPKAMVSGYPARPHREELRFEAALRQLPGWAKLLKRLAARIEKLEEETRKTC